MVWSLTHQFHKKLAYTCASNCCFACCRPNDGYAAAAPVADDDNDDDYDDDDDNDGDAEFPIFSFRDNCICILYVYIYIHKSVNQLVSRTVNKLVLSASEQT